MAPRFFDLHRTNRPFATYEKTRLRKLLFLVAFSVLVFATLMICYRIAFNRFREAERHLDIATEQVLAGDFTNALGHYDAVLEQNKRRRDAWAGRALSLMYLRRYEEALGSYERIIRLDPDNAPAWQGKGMSLERMGRFDEALNSYNRAIEIQPTFRLAVMNRDKLLEKQYQGETP